MDDQPNINPNMTDQIALVSRVLFGAVPYIGAPLAEIVGAIIPNQRLDRIAKCMAMLDQQVQGMKREVLEYRMKQEGFVDLLEDGLLQASRALSDERKRYIASLLKNSLSSDELSHAQDKRLLQLLEQVNDVEIILLKSYGLPLGEQSEAFYETHQGVLKSPIIVAGVTEDEVDKAAIYSTYRRNLLQLGLLDANFKRPKKGEFPEFDVKTGTMKASGYKITRLGRLLLRRIDADEVDES